MNYIFATVHDVKTGENSAAGAPVAINVTWTVLRRLSTGRFSALAPAGAGARLSDGHPWLSRQMTTTKDDPVPERVNLNTANPDTTYGVLAQQASGRAQSTKRSVI